MIINGDSLEVLKTFEDNSIDSVVTDPPYGLSFMGKKWDYDVPSTELWTEVFRVLKPGGHLLAFAGTRTQHRMAVNIEDAGFEIRDMIAWVYGSGFPKSLNIGKAVDKIQGNKREVVGTQKLGGNAAQSTKEKGGTYASNTNAVGVKPIDVTLTKGNSPWEGWGTALKPALEPITVARKPIKGSVANNVLEHGVGGLNIDGCRVEADSKELYRKPTEYKDISPSAGMNASKVRGSVTDDYLKGRFPANFIHDGSDEVVELFPDTGGGKYKAPNARIRNNGLGLGTTDSRSGTSNAPDQYGDSGSAARFFYCAKASKSERNKGLEGLEVIRQGLAGEHKNTVSANIHPTVKPVKLMQYLVRLVTPKSGTVLDPFNGSGTTGIACKLEGMEYIGIELDPEYCKISEARIEAWEADKQEKLI